MADGISSNIPVVAPVIPPTPAGVTAAWGSWLAGFLGWAAPPLSRAAALLYGKLAPALLQFAVPPDKVEAILVDEAGKIEALVSHDSVFIPAHPGLFSAVIQRLIPEVPELAGWLKTEISPVLLSELRTLGVGI